MGSVSIFVALGAGVLSFLSPCVLPLIPGYLSFISGVGSQEIRSGSKRAGVFYRTLFFVAGFSAVFVALGLLFSGGGMLVAGRSNRLVSIIAGVIVTILGVNTMFDFIKFLNSDIRAHVTSKPTSALGSFVVGMAFGAGWTPCVGPILASILFMAARSGGAAQSVLLLATYSAGLAVPFIAAGLFFDRLAPLWAWFKKHGLAVRIVSGLLLVGIGLSMALGRLTALNAVATRTGLGIKSFAASQPGATMALSISVIVALAAAIIVVPLVRGRSFTQPARLVVLALLLVALLLQALGIVSFPGIIASWLMFQGA